MGRLSQAGSFLGTGSLPAHVLNPTNAAWPALQTRTLSAKRAMPRFAWLAILPIRRSFAKERESLMENISVRAIARERAVSKMGLNPFSWYREMRENDPVHFDAHAQIWEIFAYQEILEVLKNP